jgi:thiamine biosynthesis lipoprotein ApbE
VVSITSVVDALVAGAAAVARPTASAPAPATAAAAPVMVVRLTIRAARSRRSMLALTAGSMGAACPRRPAAVFFEAVERLGIWVYTFHRRLTAGVQRQASAVPDGCRMTTNAGSVRRRADAEDEAVRDARLGSARWLALGTSAHVLTTDPATLGPATEAVRGVLDDVDRAVSRFRVDSELWRLNAQAGGWHEVSPLTLRALRVAVDAAGWTEGLVDPTVGASLVALGYDRTYRLIPADAPEASLVVAPIVDWQCLELDDDARRVRWPAGVVVDLGATAKGLAADLAAAAAREAAGCGVMVNLGGDLAVAGESPAGGWNIVVADSADPDRPADAEVGQVVAVTTGGLATSGTQARRWRRGGSELHHLLDPRTGRPTTGPWRTVSVAAATCVLANTASTAAVVAGADAPRWLAERGFPARLVAEDGAIRLVGDWPAAAAEDAIP